MQKIKDIGPNFLIAGGYRKGQVTLINLIGLILTLIIYVILAVPLLAPMINQIAADLIATPNEFTYMTVALLHLIPLFILMMIIITGLNYAIPQREAGRY